MTLRIVNVSPVFCHRDHRAGGVARTSFDLADALAQRGHRVTIVSPCVDLDRRFDPPDPEQSSWHDGRLTARYAVAARQTRFGTSAHGLAGALEPLLPDADVVHIHAFLSPWADRAARLARDAGKPYFIQPRGKLSPQMLANRGGAKSAYLRFLGGAKLLRDAAAVVPLTDVIADAIARWDPQITTAVCPNGLDVADYPKPVSPDSSSPLNRPYVLYLGMLDPRKRLDLLIDAFAKAASDMNDTALVLAGGDDYGQRAALEQRIADQGLHGRVVMPGHVTGADKLRWLEHASLFALPSEGEGLSVAMIEALRYALPCLVSPGCNAPQIESEGAGQVIPLETEAWAAALRDWSTDTDRRTAASASAAQMFERRYTLDRVAEQMERVYLDALETPQP